MAKKIIDYNNITFSRKEMAILLNCTIVTIRNRESKKIYPDPQRSTGNFRLYTIADVYLLQMLTFNKIIMSSILSLLYDLGYTDTIKVEKHLNEQLAVFKNGLDTRTEPLPVALMDYQQGAHDFVLLEVDGKDG